jgi:hypothetical protein
MAKRQIQRDFVSLDDMDVWHGLSRTPICGGFPCARSAAQATRVDTPWVVYAFNHGQQQQQ